MIALWIFLYTYSKYCEKYNLERRIRPIIICLIIINAILILMYTILIEFPYKPTIAYYIYYSIILLLQIVFLLHYKDYCRENNKILNFITIAIVTTIIPNILAIILFYLTS
jgi:hypothetical protein